MGLSGITRGHLQCGFEQSLRVLVEPSNEWNGRLLPSRLHGGVTFVPRLVVPPISSNLGMGIKSNSTHLSVILSGGTQIYIHLHVTFDRFPWLQSWENRLDKGEM